MRLAKLNKSGSWDCDVLPPQPGRKNKFVARAERLWLYFAVPSADATRKRLEIFYAGHVQGVGFRYAIKNVAAGFEVTGTVRNLDDGRVELITEGAARELEEFQRAIQDSEVGRFIRHQSAQWLETKNDFRGFEIIK